MGLVVSYDEAFGTPSSEIELSSGEHILMTLSRDGLAVKVLARPGNTERMLFECSPDTAARICDGLFENHDPAKTTPLQILVAAVSQSPHAASVEDAFRSASD